MEKLSRLKPVMMGTLIILQSVNPIAAAMSQDGLVPEGLPHLQVLEWKSAETESSQHQKSVTTETQPAAMAVAHHA